jgi:hypothetical protein
VAAQLADSQEGHSSVQLVAIKNRLKMLRVRAENVASHWWPSGPASQVHLNI